MARQKERTYDRQGILGIRAVDVAASEKRQRATVPYILGSLDRALACSMAAYAVADRPYLEHLVAVESDSSLALAADCHC